MLFGCLFYRGGEITVFCIFKSSHSPAAADDIRCLCLLPHAPDKGDQQPCDRYPSLRVAHLRLKGRLTYRGGRDQCLCRFRAPGPSRTSRQERAGPGRGLEAARRAPDAAGRPPESESRFQDIVISLAPRRASSDNRQHEKGALQVISEASGHEQGAV